jgi:hypothetical protein
MGRTFCCRGQHNNHHQRAFHVHFGDSTKEITFASGLALDRCAGKVRFRGCGNRKAMRDGSLIAVALFFKRFNFKTVGSSGSRLTLVGGNE